MSKPIHIGLFGKMASGKSLVAQYLVDKYGFIELAFATRLKELCIEMFGIDPVKKGERDRLVLQQFAQYMRQIDPNVWVRYILNNIPEASNIVISDVRFPNEHWQLKQLQFFMVRMNMDRATQERIVKATYPGLPLILLDDYSERAVDKEQYDWIIDNNSGIPLDSVYHQVDIMVATIKGWL